MGQLKIGDRDLLRTFIGEPDVAIGRKSEIVDRGEFVSEVVIEDRGGFTGAGVQAIDTCSEDSIGRGTPTGVYESFVKSRAGWKVNWRI